jgi:hypothetical protein
MNMSYQDRVQVFHSILRLIFSTQENSKTKDK